MTTIVRTQWCVHPDGTEHQVPVVTTDVLAHGMLVGAHFMARSAVAGPSRPVAQLAAPATARKRPATARGRGTRVDLSFSQATIDHVYL